MIDTGYMKSVSMLDPVEKKIAKAFGIVPNANLESALENLLAEFTFWQTDASTDDIKSTLFIGKTYDAMELYENAEIYLKKNHAYVLQYDCMSQLVWSRKLAKKHFTLLTAILSLHPQIDSAVHSQRIQRSVGNLVFCHSITAILVLEDRGSVVPMYDAT
ncbi:hypothetical protein KIN20_013052 [Parelaphostrongylus tenuis]|uniref:Uncharacterized protein n=1 Tax=Parelaphostrongylus tenuis TaxID=148309 RepID=A0AAD5MBK0_PARTN|nr:hypothetical protein KIN20_013052 [Parelaphostrongylus tenuis]